MKFLISISIVFTLFSCTNNSIITTPIAVNKIDSVWLNSIIKNSDSVFTKPYKRTDFVTATFYYNGKDSSICQVMKDSAGMVRQVLITNKNIRSHFSQYYPNGQLIENISLNKFGRNDGNAIYYYEDGKIKSKGQFIDGLYSGEWKIFDNSGKQLQSTMYNSNGNIIP